MRLASVLVISKGFLGIYTHAESHFNVFTSKLNPFFSTRAVEKGTSFGEGDGRKIFVVYAEVREGVRRWRGRQQNKTDIPSS